MRGVGDVGVAVIPHHHPVFFGDRAQPLGLENRRGPKKARVPATVWLQQAEKCKSCRREGRKCRTREESFRELDGGCVDRGSCAVPILSLSQGPSAFQGIRPFRYHEAIRVLVEHSLASTAAEVVRVSGVL